MQPTDNLLMEGFNLMLLGMGFVFVFLTALVLATNLMSRLVQRFFPDLPPPQKAAPHQDSSQATPVIAAITAALHQHRLKQQDKQ